MPKPAADQRILVFGVRLSTLKPFPYMQPFDRGMLADALESLAAKGVRAVGLDMLFVSPTEPAKDARLRAVLEAFPVPVVVAWAEQGRGLDPEEGPWLAAFAANLGKGWPNFGKDSEGTVRWLNTVHGAADSATRLSLAAALAQAVGVPATDTPRRLDYRPARSPDPDEAVFPLYPLEAAAILPPALLKDRIVLIGADLRGTDEHRVPGYVVGQAGQAAVLPGVAIHAHALAQLLDGREVPELSLAGRAALVALVVAAGLVIAIVTVPWWVRIGLGVLTIAAIVGAGFLFVQGAGPELPMVTPILGYLGAFGGGLIFVGRTLRRDKRFIRDVSTPAFAWWAHRHQRCRSPWAWG